MSLRTRVTALTVIGVVLVAVIGAVVLVQFRDVVVTGTSIRDRLTPAVALSDQLVLARVSAGGSISDVVLDPSDKLILELNNDLKDSTSALEQIDAATDDEELQPLIEKARVTQQAWVDVDVTPVLTALADGKRKKAQRITASTAAWDAYDAMVASAKSLQSAIDQRQRNVTERLTGFVRELAVVLALAVVILLLALIGLWWSLREWIIHPLQRLQDAMRISADPSSHESPIQPSGPPELRAVGVDAEFMRRQLVGQIDEARAATQALAQDAPLVAAVREELAVASDHELSGFAIHGELHSAEGVLAGDWWDCIPLSGGRTGIVIADVSGHGAAAGVTALRTRTILRQDLLEGNTPAHALAEAAESWSDDGSFVTAVILVLHPDGLVEWANAGHHPPRLVAKWNAEDLETTGPLLSSLGGEWTDKSRHLAHGDIIVAYTDGLIESRDAAGQEVGASWVAEFAEFHREEALNELAAQLIANARANTVEWHRDDVTLVCLRRI